jgi:hypothetical protein
MWSCWFFEIGILELFGWKGERENFIFEIDSDRVGGKNIGCEK